MRIIVEKIGPSVNFMFKAPATDLHFAFEGGKYQEADVLSQTPRKPGLTTRHKNAKRGSSKERLSTLQAFIIPDFPFEFAGKPSVDVS